MREVKRVAEEIFALTDTVHVLINNAGGVRDHRHVSSEGHMPEHAAQTLYWIATSSETGVDGGRYCHDLQEEEPAPQALNDAAAARLWAVTESRLATLGL